MLERDPLPRENVRRHFLGLVESRNLITFLTERVAHYKGVKYRPTLKPGSSVAAQVKDEVDDIHQKRHYVHSY